MKLPRMFAFLFHEADLCGMYKVVFNPLAPKFEKYILETKEKCIIEVW